MPHWDSSFCLKQSSLKYVVCSEYRNKETDKIWSIETCKTRLLKQQGRFTFRHSDGGISYFMMQMIFGVWKKNTIKEKRTPHIFLGCAFKRRPDSKFEPEKLYMVHNRYQFYKDFLRWGIITYINNGYTNLELPRVQYRLIMIYKPKTYHHSLFRIPNP